VKAVMYHYVRPAPSDLPYFRYLHLEDFCHQLDHLQASFGFMPRDRFLALIGGDAVPHDGVILTFDDGFIDHYTYVLPELLSRGLWGLFYVPTGVYGGRQALPVHRVHLLLGRYPSLSILDALQECLRPEMLPADRVAEFESLTYRRQLDSDEATLRVKRILNYFVADAWRVPLLDRLQARFPLGDDLFGRLYMSEEHLSALQHSGMIVGSHGVSHRVMSQLTLAEQRHEIDASLAFLETTLGPPPVRSFCYPYGGAHTFTQDTKSLLHTAGCRFAFSVEDRDVSREDLARQPFALPRFDCQSFPFGAASCGPHRPLPAPV
jgi:peptidoglycan/xylan/chitin deacetylase (PgdA/CDA1 family)